MPIVPIETDDNEAKSSLGEAPAVLAKRFLVKPNAWCEQPDIEFDPLCDPENPRTIYYKDVCIAAAAIKNQIPNTPLVRAKHCGKFEMELYFKCENVYKTGSFHERGALYSLCKLNCIQRKEGVLTASTGNWGMALAYYGRQLKIPVTVVLPLHTYTKTVEKCREYGADIILQGKNLAEAKRQAFVLKEKRGIGTYINGYDHPNVIAAEGSIGLEILKQLPDTDAILIPVGGGALIAGIAAAVKQMKPSILIYGVQPVKCCSFFKAMENEKPYQTETPPCPVGTLNVPTAGFNSFQTALSLIDKMVLIDDDWVSRAILYLVEEEKFMVDLAGAMSFGALLAIPNILPELLEKKVVCLLTGGNINWFLLKQTLERGKVVEGRHIKLTVKLIGNNTTSLQVKILSMISNIGCSLVRCYKEGAWTWENDLETVYLTLIIETRDLQQACTLKRVMNKLFPGICEFVEEPFSPIPKCICFPNRCML